MPPMTSLLVRPKNSECVNVRAPSQVMAFDYINMYTLMPPLLIGMCLVTECLSIWKRVDICSLAYTVDWDVL